MVLYGIYGDSTVTVNFYDGVLRGGVKAYQNGIIKAIANGTTIYTEQTAIDSEQYESCYLVNEHDVAKIGNTKYKKLIDAVNDANENDIIELIDDNYLFYSLTIAADKVFTIKTNGYKIITGNPIVNNGKITITNNSTAIDGALDYNGASYYITNNSSAELTLNNLRINASFGIDNKGSLSTNNLFITAYNTAINNSGTLTATNTRNISGSDFAIYNDGGTASYNGGTIIGNIYNNSGELNITSSTATKTSRGQTSYMTNNGNMNLNSFQATFNDEFIETSSYSNPSYIRALYNTGTLNTSNDTAIRHIAGNAQETFWHHIISLYNDGGTVISSGTTYEANGITSMSRRTNAYAYGIYNPTGNITIKTGAVIAHDIVSTFGIWNDTGTITIGEAEPQNSPNYGRDTANVSVSNPDISAISTIGSYKGIAIKNNTGKVYYYDGKITGSTAAMPEKPAGVEYLYEPKDYVDEETGYHYRVLEWMREQAGQ